MNAYNSTIMTRAATNYYIHYRLSDCFVNILYTLWKGLMTHHSPK